MGAIYLIRNKINGYVYIGQTTRNAILRFNEHVRNYAATTGIDCAISKYGQENFEFTVIEDNIDDPDVLNSRERFYIKQYDSYAWNGHGYNLTVGGSGKMNLDDFNLSEQQLDFIFDALQRPKEFTTKEIADHIGINRKTLQDINYGYLAYRENYSYPIRVTKTLTSATYKKILYLFIVEDKTNKQIADELTLSYANVCEIISGRSLPSPYILYPLSSNMIHNKSVAQHNENAFDTTFIIEQGHMTTLEKRKNKKNNTDKICDKRYQYKKGILSNSDVIAIANMLLDINQTYKTIGAKFDVSYGTIAAINTGKGSYGIALQQASIEFPIRVSNKVTSQMLRNMTIDLCSGDYTRVSIKTKYHVSYDTAISVAKGQFFRYQGLDYPLDRNIGSNIEKINTIDNLLLASNIIFVSDKRTNSTTTTQRTVQNTSDDIYQLVMSGLKTGNIKHYADNQKYLIGIDGKCYLETSSKITMLKSYALLQCVHRKNNGRAAYKLFNSDGTTTNVDIAVMLATAFIDNPNNYQYVCHKDGDIANNSIDNLYWSNTIDEHIPAQKNGSLSIGTVNKIIDAIQSTDDSFVEIAAEYNVSRTTITNINKGSAYHRDNLYYPLRDDSSRKIKSTVIEAIKEALLHKQHDSYTKIANTYNVSPTTVSDINIGKTHFDANLIYPLNPELGTKR